LWISQVTFKYEVGAWYCFDTVVAAGVCTINAAVLFRTQRLALKEACPLFQARAGKALVKIAAIDIAIVSH
jgi:hypothetical protein